VGQDVVLTVRTRRGEPDKRLRVVVRAEGPTRVLTVLDEARHLLPPPPPPGGRRTAPGERDAPPPGAAALPSGLLWEVSAELAAVGLSLVGPSQEVAYFRATGIAAALGASAARRTASLRVQALQLDNPSPWAAFPVTLVLPAPASKLRTSVAAAVERGRRPALAARLAVWRRRPAGVVCVELAQLEVASVGVYVEQQHALELGALLSTLGAALGAAGAGGAGAAAAAGGVLGEAAPARPRPAASPFSLPALDLDLAAGGAAPLPQLLELLELDEPGGGGGGGGGGPSSQKVYIDLLSLSPVEVTVSFLSSPVRPFAPGHPRLAALQRLLSLADVEDARLRLAGLRLRNPLMDAAALRQRLQRHYLRALVPELYKVVGSASVLGDPVGLVHHLGLGVWALVAGPAAGLVESARARGPRQFVAGVLRGGQGLAVNVVFAAANAATKAAGAARKAIVVWGLERCAAPGQGGGLCLGRGGGG
jgi:hypothetical protein